MNNSIRVSLTFSFKGETHSPTAVLDLDPWVERDNLPDLHAMLAHSAGIDTYSYAFEVMQASDLHYSDPTGLAADYLHDGHFDMAGFMAAALEQRLVDQLQAIAANSLDLDKLDDLPGLREALLQAYRLGQQA